MIPGSYQLGQLMSSFPHWNCLLPQVHAHHPPTVPRPLLGPVSHIYALPCPTSTSLRLWPFLSLTTGLSHRPLPPRSLLRFCLWGSFPTLRSPPLESTALLGVFPGMGVGSASYGAALPGFAQFQEFSVIWGVGSEHLDSIAHDSSARVTLMSFFFGQSLILTQC